MLLHFLGYYESSLDSKNNIRLFLINQGRAIDDCCIGGASHPSFPEESSPILERNDNMTTF